MTNKEYKERLNQHVQFDNFGYLGRKQVSELGKDIAQRKRNGEIVLDGFGKRASLRKVDGGYVLTSYYTDVCSFVDGKFNKLWYGFSATTMKHINLFREFIGLDRLSKKEWVAM